MVIPIHEDSSDFPIQWGESKKGTQAALGVETLGSGCVPVTKNWD